MGKIGLQPNTHSIWHHQTWLRWERTIHFETTPWQWQLKSSWAGVWCMGFLPGSYCEHRYDCVLNFIANPFKSCRDHPSGLNCWTERLTLPPWELTVWLNISQNRCQDTQSWRSLFKVIWAVCRPTLPCGFDAAPSPLAIMSTSKILQQPLPLCVNVNRTFPAQSLHFAFNAIPSCLRLTQTKAQTHR